MIPTPTCGRPCREPLPTVHIWPPSPIPKGLKIGIFQWRGGKPTSREGRAKSRKAASSRSCACREAMQTGAEVHLALEDIVPDLGDPAPRESRKSPWIFKGCAHRRDNSPMLTRCTIRTSFEFADPLPPTRCVDLCSFFSLLDRIFSWSSARQIPETWVRVRFELELIRSRGASSPVGRNLPFQNLNN